MHGRHISFVFFQSQVIYPKTTNGVSTVVATVNGGKVRTPTPKPQTRNPKPETILNKKRIPNPETRNQKPEKNLKTETRRTKNES